MKDRTTLRRFRHDLYDCFLRSKDALFQTVDALMTQTHAQSFPELSQALCFERKWPSLYEAFEDGRIDEEAVRRLFARHMPLPQAGKRMWVGVDASGLGRRAAVTSPDRTAQPVHNVGAGSKVITFGWQWSTLVVLSEPVSSWTYILDQERISSQTTAVQVAEAQLQRLDASLPQGAAILMDRGYDANWMWCRCQTLQHPTLIRIKSNRCVYRQAPAPTGKKGRPKLDGDKLQPSDASTHTRADVCISRVDEQGRTIEVSCWKNMHLKEARWLQVSIVRVVRPHASNSERDPRVSWFVCLAGPQEDVAQIALGYVLRFGQEHGYRFDKQGLLWDKPRLRTPEQSERWSWVVAMAHNHLLLARELVERQLRPWEAKQRPMTPQQVRRGMEQLLAQLGTPARPPQPRGKSKGRWCGMTVQKAKRHAIIRKTPKVPPIVPI